MGSLLDLVGWRDEYEPFDLPGWIPDFILYGKEQEILVEAKPYSAFAQYDTGKIERAAKDEGKEILLWGPPSGAIPIS